jgi:hypothetical protein
VFVGGGVIGEVRADAVEDAVDLGFVGDVGDPGGDRGFVRFAVEFEHEVVEAGLIVVEHVEFAGVEAEDLAAEFRTDRTGRPGDEDNLIADRVAAGFVVDFDGFAAEQVFERDVAEGVVAALAGGP